MRILLIIDCYLPSPKSVAQMIHDLALEFRMKDHKVTILAPSESLSGSFTADVEEEIEIARYKSGRIKGVSRWIRGLNEITLSFVAFFQARHYLTSCSFDGIVFYSPSIFFGPLVFILRRWWRASTYLILRDIFPDWAVDTGVLRKGAIYRIFKIFERIQYAVSDAIGVETSRSVDYFKGTAEFSKIELLRNWTKTDYPVRLNRSFRQELGLEGKVVFFYGGNIGVAQDMDNIVRLAERIQDVREDCHFLFVGEGSEVVRLSRMIREKNISNLQILPAVSPEIYFSMLSEFDVGLISLDKRIKTFSTTGKLLGYLRCGLPVLASYNPGNDLEELLRESKCGLGSLNGDDDQLFANALELCDRNKRSNMAAKTKKLLHEVFSVRTAAKQIAASLSK